MSKREPVSSVNLLNPFLFRNFTILIIFCSHDTMRFCTAPIQALSRHLLWVVFVLLANRASFLAVCWFDCGWWRCSRLLFCSVLCFGSSFALFVASGSVWLGASWCSCLWIAFWNVPVIFSAGLFWCDGLAVKAVQCWLWTDMLLGCGLWLWSWVGLWFVGFGLSFLYPGLYLLPNKL